MHGGRRIRASPELYRFVHQTRSTCDRKRKDTMRRRVGKPEEKGNTSTLYSVLVSRTGANHMHATCKRVRTHMPPQSKPINYLAHAHVASGRVNAKGGIIVTNKCGFSTASTSMVVMCGYDDCACPTCQCIDVL